MAFLTPDEILDKVQARITDQSAATRIKLLGWLNDIMRDVVNQPRMWGFLKKSTSLAITANAITLPADFGVLTSIQNGDYFFTPDEQMTDEEAYFALLGGGTVPYGFTLGLTTITFIPAAIGTATLKYEATMVDVIDDTTPTLFPQEFRNLLVFGTLAMFYEDDRDDGYAIQVQVYGNEMKKIKALDNKKKAMPKINYNGYQRERE